MPTFLSDPSSSLYLFLAVMVVICAAVWYQKREKKSLLALVVSGVLLLALALCDYYVESPREQANRKVLAMTQAATARDPNRFIEHISASFNHNGANRDAVKNSRVWELIRQRDARVVAWGFGKPDFQQVAENEIEIGFYAKAEAPAISIPGIWFVRARFIRDPDGEYRMKGMKFYTSEGGMNQEVPAPGFP